eukprot:GHRR01016662.1.p1 GENE.GHRR01016662.1~~GHRR01016662.1.p1  ORF type:complete len:419 (+),score=164.37 GHRR01016662.1:736-1992(+)
MLITWLAAAQASCCSIKIHTAAVLLLLCFCVTAVQGQLASNSNNASNSLPAAATIAVSALGVATAAAAAPPIVTAASIAIAGNAGAIDPPAMVQRLNSSAAQVALLPPANFSAYKVSGELPRLLPWKLLVSSKQPAQSSLTVVTALTLERLNVLEAQCRSWPGGPLTAVIYAPLTATPQQLSGSTQQQQAVAEISGSTPNRVPTPEQQQQLKAIGETVSGVVQRSDALADNACSLTALLVYEIVARDMEDQLPINSLRNQALLLAQTPLVAMLDVDMLASVSLTDAVLNATQAQGLVGLLKGQKRVVILPAFETIPWESPGPGHAEALLHKLAAHARKSGKAELQALIDSQLLQVFNQAVNPRGHGETDYRRWFRSTASTTRSYQVQPKSQRYEPWYVLDRRMALQHPYDEIFRGYGE